MRHLTVVKALRGRRRACRYHSHPIFAPKPSQKDAENQRNYQALFRCAGTGLEPFLGAIVGPFDVQLPTVARAQNLFMFPCAPEWSHRLGRKEAVARR